MTKKPPSEIRKYLRVWSLKSLPNNYRMSFKDLSLAKITKPYAKWHQRRFLLTLAQSRHVGKTYEGNLKLALNMASSNDTIFLLSTKIRASLTRVISHVALHECETWFPRFKLRTCAEFINRRRRESVDLR